MELKQFATILNTVFVPNEFGNPDATPTPGVIIAEDLTGVVDLGKKLTELKSTDFMDYMEQIAVGVVRTYIDDRRYPEYTFGLDLTGEEYGGCIQRVRARRLKMQDTAILNPVSVYDSDSAPSYLDGHFYGDPLDVRVFTQDVAGKLVTSVSEAKLRKMVTTREGWLQIMALFESNKENTLADDLSQLSKTVLRKMIMNADSGNRRINLIPLYNAQRGLESGDPGFVTLADYAGNEDFKLFCQKVIIRLKDAMREFNKRFNDGSIETFTPANDVRVTLLSEFATELDFARSSVYHTELVATGEYSTIEFWQNPGLALYEGISTTSNFDKISETWVENTETKTQAISYCVGLIRDKLSGGIVQKLNETTVEPVGAAGFINYHHHIARQYWVDDRAANVILCLDEEPSV